MPMRPLPPLTLSVAALLERTERLLRRLEDRGENARCPDCLRPVRHGAPHAVRCELAELIGAPRERAA